jgi:uncharacterized protein (DUF2345 family)
MADTTASSTQQPDPKPGPFLARVVSNIDPTNMGGLEVEILRPTGASAGQEGQLHRVKYMSPFYGVTGVDYTKKDPNNYNNVQKSYGMWMIPPDVGVIVMIIFVDGDSKRGYWFGCVPDENMNFMMPGLAATQKVVEDVEKDRDGRYGRVPVAEYNKNIDDNRAATDPTENYKPEHPFAAILKKQGLLFDDARGITTSSARREAPSMVFGISTPGPIDKKGPKGFIGKEEHKVHTFVSRLGGSTFVMDDGDAAWTRKGSPATTPPDYASGDADEAGGDVRRPHNELFRIRTRTGHQILLHNSEDLIYITNSRGTAWIEFTSNGKIDIFAQDSISIHTDADLNLHANRDINLEAGRNFNLKVGKRHQTEVGKDKICIVNGNVKIQVDGTQDETITGAVKESYQATLDLTTGGATNITTGGALNLKVSGASVVSSSGDFTIKAANTAIDGGNVNLNSGIAGDAGPAKPAVTPDPLTMHRNYTSESATVESILHRIPNTEPWPGHENLDPVKFTKAHTDREVDADIEVPDAYKKYSTAQDTFRKGK